MAAREIEFFFDIASPYSYLAATQVEGLRARTGAGVRWRPFLLGGVFKATGNDMPARVAAKARWMLGDLGRWADQYGVPFRMPSRFPLNTLLTQRVLAAAAREDGAGCSELALALYRAYWVEDRDVSDGDTLAELAGGLGLAGVPLVAAAKDPEIKGSLRRWTQEAVQRGAFGAPTFFIGDQMFWGNDRLHHVEACARA